MTFSRYHCHRRPFPWQIVAALIVGAAIGFIVFQVIGVM